MNLSKIYTVSFLILLIATYETTSGIILSLIMKVLLLKGALFMTMPLSLGAFMMGQGMGFFAGNMMGGYMMLRAANKYHHQEMAKVTSGYGVPAGYGGHGATHGSSGWGQPHGWKYESAYDKGKDIGSALHALSSHKQKLASAFTRVKSALGWGKAVAVQKLKPLYAQYGGWGWKGQSQSYGYGPPKGHDYHYTAHTKYHPISSKYASPPKYGQTYKFDPYSHLKGGSSSPGSKGWGQPEASFYPESYSHQAEGSNYHVESVTQDPSNTYYTSAYEGPGHEYTGILASKGESNPYHLTLAEEKSSSEDGLVYKDRGQAVTPSASQERSTLAPNPLLEKYLEKRLEEEASKQRNSREQEEAKQLIEILRKAYLKQLLDSLKEEENVLKTSTESYQGRDSRSLEGTQTVEEKKMNVIQQILQHSFARSLEKTERNQIERRFDNGQQREIEAATRRPAIPTFSSTENEINALFSLVGNVTESSTENSAKEESVETTTAASKGFSLNDLLKNPSMWVETELPGYQRVKRGTGGSQEQKPAEASSSKTKEQQDAFVEDILKFFTLLNVLDQDKCLKKLVCDVHTSQKDPATLTQYEQNILITFRLMKALMPEGEEDSSTKYRRAALIGETGMSLELCQETYNTCNYSSSQIISLGSQAEREPSPEDWVENGPKKARSEYVTMPRVRRSLRSFYL